MLRKANNLGSANIVDPSGSILVDSVTAIATSALGLTGIAYLNSANLGTQDFGYMHLLYDKGDMLPVGEQVFFGVCLRPMESFTTDIDPLYLDYSITATYDKITGGVMSPFVGYIDTAGVAIGSGFDANNEVVPYSFLPVNNTLPYSMSAVGQATLKAVVGGGLEPDKFLCVGVLVRNVSAAPYAFANFECQISARYCYQPFVVQEA